jgi:hypothetical protein
MEIPPFFGGGVLNDRRNFPLGEGNSPWLGGKSPGILMPAHRKPGQHFKQISAVDASQLKMKRKN